MQVLIYDNNKVFTGIVKDVEKLEENMTTVPLLVGYIKPKFNEELEEWYEGATDEEVKKWKEENEKPSKTKISLTLEEQAIEALSIQVAKLTLLK